jgi:hypothetical protein
MPASRPRRRQASGDDIELLFTTRLTNHSSNGLDQSVEDLLPLSLELATL